MKLEFVSLKQALSLKDLGFPQVYDVFGGTTCHYIDESTIGYHSEIGIYDNDICAAPSLELAAKWLREVKNIAIDIHTYFSVSDDNLKHYSFTTTNIYRVFSGDNFTSYEKALSAGLDKAIEILNNYTIIEA